MGLCRNEISAFSATLKLANINTEGHLFLRVVELVVVQLALQLQHAVIAYV